MSISNLWSFCKSNDIKSEQILLRIPESIRSLAATVAYGKSLSEDQIQHIETEMSRGSTKNRDGRGPVEFAKAIITAWLWEEAVAIKLNLLTNPSACDHNRELYCEHITNTADLCTHDGRPIEVVIDNTSFTLKNNCLDLRSNKFKHLVDTNSMIVIAYPNGQTKMVDPRDCAALAIDHPIWRKPAYRITLP